MNTRPVQIQLGLYFVAVFVSTTRLAAQVPELVMFFKTLGVVQTAASSQEPFQPGLGVVAEFPAPTSDTMVVQVSGNGVVLGVPRIAPQVYFLAQSFADEAALDRALPDGAYTLTVTGGGSGSSATPLVLPARGSLRPVLFTNFDRLQAWPGSTVRFTWEPIPGASNDDAVSFTVTRSNGTLLYQSAAGAISSSATFIEVPGLPVNEELFGTLTCLRLSLGLANNGNTVTTTGQGFAVRVPLRIVPLIPGILRQPRSQTVAAGSTVVFSADITGSSLAYQWRHNGVPIAGANSAMLVVPNATSDAAGFYTLDATNAGGSVTTDAVTLTIDSRVLPGRITNLAIRSQTGSAAQTLIVGFAIGPAGVSGAKPILLRGIGPALRDFGVPGILADPKIELYAGTNKISENDDWAGNAEVADVARSCGAFALTSFTSKDAALYNSAFAPGSYSVQLTGATNTTGVALAEIYDATPRATFTRSTPRLVNVSARSHVGTGADVLIAGFAISADSPRTVLIRAVGPTLDGFGVQGTVANPKLELFSGPTKLDENDDWGGIPALGSIFSKIGAFALSGASRDAALLVTLPPGSYTAQVSGVNNTTGIALVELYEVP